jgi:hypothetical protein
VDLDVIQPATLAKANGLSSIQKAVAQWPDVSPPQWNALGSKVWTDPSLPVDASDLRGRKIRV